MTVQALTKFRDDGKEVPSTMSSIEMLEQGWSSSPVRKIAWLYDDLEYQYRSPYTLSACIVPGAKYIALVESVDEQQNSSLFRMISGDGRSQVTVPNIQLISGRSISGQFEWFSHLDSTPGGAVAIVFRPHEGSDAFLIKVDAASGTTISAEYILA